MPMQKQRGGGGGGGAGSVIQGRKVDGGGDVHEGESLEGKC